jgi:formamidopyrimidine-DNA glycosylase
MPELAEVEFFRKRWHLAAAGQRVISVAVHATAKVFRGTDSDTLRRCLKGTRFLSSEAAAKQMLFRFTGDCWLGIHLGMSGELYAQSSDYSAQKHDHLVLATKRHRLVFTDPRMFGRVLFHKGSEPPKWWTEIAPPILSSLFTVGAVADFLRRRSRAPIKAVLLMQERFPGIGNWMADEILWRAAIHPKQPAGTLSPAQTKTLWRECRNVCRLALEKIAGKANELPPDLNANIPQSWLFHHRWEAGGRCPKTGVLLMREEVGGRTTCWSPARQSLPTRLRSSGKSSRAR